MKHFKTKAPCRDADQGRAAECSRDGAGARCLILLPQARQDTFPSRHTIIQHQHRPSSSTSTDPDEEEEEEEEVSDELLPEEQEEVFDSQGHSSHGRWRCPEPGCGVLLGANAVQANGVHTHAARHRRTSEAAAAAAAAAATIPVIFVYERAGGACVHASTCDHTMSKSSWAAVASCFLRELRVPSLPVGSRTFYLMVQEGSHNPLHCPLAGMI